MRIHKYSLIAALAVGSLLAFTNLTSAQDAKAPQENQDGKKRPGFSPQQRVERMASVLNLTDAQKTKVTALFEEDAKKIRELRADTNVPQDQRREKARALREESDKKLQAILTPEQWEKWQKERSQMLQRRGEKKADQKTEK
jgi:protein CpxP